jgi:hypothetical protein
MSAPPQQRPNIARHAERNAKIFKLRLAGWTERAIAAEVSLSPARVHEIVTEQVAATVGPPAEEYASHREAELEDLYRRSYALIFAAKDPADKLRAVNQCARINESRRKLRGADAPQALTLSLDQRQDLESAVVAEALVEVIPAICAAAGADPFRRTQLERYGIMLAQWVLGGRQGDRPECEPQRLALTAGSSERPADGPAADAPPPVPPKVSASPADAVLDALADFEADYGSLGEDD